MPESDISKMKVVDLKRELKLRGLSITGIKAELQERLQKAILDGDLSLEDTAISGEGLLEDASTDEDEKPILTLPPDENELLKSPTSEPRGPIHTGKSKDVAAPQPKKIVLKRKSSITSLSTETTAEITAPRTDLEDVAENEIDSTDREAKILKLDEEPKLVTNASVGENGCDTEPNILKLDEKPKQVIKISALTLEERLQLRAKKFGLEENKVSGPKVNSISTGAGAKDVDPKQIETLKKRAERFGCVVSSTIAKITADERLEKRKQRFGDLLTGGEKKVPKICKDIYAEKARQRLERFKTAQ